MKRIFISTLVILTFIVYTNAENIKRGYKSLEKKECEKAIEAFTKNISDEPDNVGANFGLALALADDQSTCFNIIDAWQYIEKIQGKLDNLSQEDIDIIGEYFLNSEINRSSRPVKKKMEIAISAIEDRLIKYIREENNLEAVYEVLQRYPNFRHYDNVVHIRNQFEFRKYEKINNKTGYEEFIKKFPDAAQIDKARKHLNQIAFDETKSLNSINAYNSYIISYPTSEFLQEAIKLRNAAAYADAERVNTLQAYEQFIISYPEALEISNARTKEQELLYEQAKKIKSLQSYNEFIKKYPQGRYYFDIFNLKSTELGNQFLQKSSMSSPTPLWSKGFDNNDQIEYGGMLGITPQNEIIVACNTRPRSSGYADAWVIKLDQAGKMLWNKFVGQSFEDSIMSVLINTAGEIILVGYTNLTADESSKMGWMFKLAVDGKKIWNKNLGKININACAIDKYNRIYIGGFSDADSSAIHYSLTVFNDEAKILSQRDFSGIGRINDLDVSSGGNLLIAGSNWMAMMDQRRYIIWDDSLSGDYNAMKCVSGNTASYFTGFKTGNVFYSKYDMEGKKLWFKNFGSPDISQTVQDIALLNNDDCIVLEQKQNGSKIKIISPSGEFKSVRELTGNITLHAVESVTGGAILVVSDEDLIVIKYSGILSF